MGPLLGSRMSKVYVIIVFLDLSDYRQIVFGSETTEKYITILRVETSQIARITVTCFPQDTVGACKSNRKDQH
jgi:hypothetical protein